MRESRFNLWWAIFILFVVCLSYRGYLSKLDYEINCLIAGEIPNEIVASQTRWQCVLMFFGEPSEAARVRDAAKKKMGGVRVDQP